MRTHLSTRRRRTFLLSNDLVISHWWSAEIATLHEVKTDLVWQEGERAVYKTIWLSRRALLLSCAWHHKGSKHFFCHKKQCLGLTATLLKTIAKSRDTSRSRWGIDHHGLWRTAGSVFLPSDPGDRTLEMQARRSRRVDIRFQSVYNLNGTVCPTCSSEKRRSSHGKYPNGVGGKIGAAHVP